VIYSEISRAGNGFVTRVKVRSTESLQPVFASLSGEDTEFDSHYLLTRSGRYFLDVGGNFNQ
jgi:hypothetical protein